MNGNRVTGEVMLSENDVIRIGNTTLPWRSYFAGGISGQRAVQRRISFGTSSDNDVVIQGTGVSRRHCAILKYSDGSYAIEDYSTNGTFVNGRRISGSESLNVGDRVSLCSSDVSWWSYFNVPDPINVSEEEKGNGNNYIPEPEKTTSSYSIIAFVLALASFLIILYIVIDFLTSGVSQFAKALGGTITMIKLFPIYLRGYFGIGGQWFAMIAALIAGGLADFIHEVLDESEENKLGSATMFLANAGLSLSVIFLLLAIFAEQIVALY